MAGLILSRLEIFNIFNPGEQEDWDKLINCKPQLLSWGFQQQKPRNDQALDEPLLYSCIADPTYRGPLEALHWELGDRRLKGISEISLFPWLQVPYCICFLVQLVYGHLSNPEGHNCLGIVAGDVLFGHVDERLGC